MKIIQVGTVTSTMDIAKNYINYSTTVIIANNQTKGRGKPGNTWKSEYGNLACTFVFNDIKTLEWALFMGVAVGQTINHFQPWLDIKYKYPNDVYVNQKKICGVLVEKIDTKCLIGVGVNLFCSPDQKFTCLKELGSDISPMFFLNKLILEIVKLSQKDYEQIWKKNLFF